MSTTATTHIELDEHGVAWIANTQVKVIEVAVDKIVHGSSPEEMRFQYPHLSLAQIHAALAYYYDNQAQLDDEIRRQWVEADELAEGASDRALREKLLALKEAQQSVMFSTRTYRRRSGGETWHWCRNCSSWPTSDFEEETSPGQSKGCLCTECRAMEKAGGCRP